MCFSSFHFGHQSSNGIISVSVIIIMFADITGGGFIFNETALRLVAGVSWLLDAQSNAITWNCFVEGNIESSLPWSEWKLMLNGMEIGFEKEDSRWGFTAGQCVNYHKFLFI